MTAPDDGPVLKPVEIVYASEHDIADSLMDRAGMSPAQTYEVASGLAADLIETTECAERLEAALGHTDCVAREDHDRLSEAVNSLGEGVAPFVRSQVEMKARAERAEAERDRVRREATADLDEAQRQIDRLKDERDRLREALEEADNLASEADRGDVSVYLGGAIDDYKRVRAALDGGDGDG